MFSTVIFALALLVSFSSGCSSEVAEPSDATCPAQTKRSVGEYKPFDTYTNPGGRAVGAACAFDNQCVTNRCSGNAIAGTCGECVTIRALGQTCTGPHEGCSSSAVCQDGICKSLRKLEGEACRLGAKGHDFEDCDVELFCAPTRGLGGEPGTCTRYQSPGECCGDFVFRCGYGMTCNRETSVCEVPPESECMYGYYCVGENICGDDGRCHPGTLPANAECGIVNGEFVDNACSPGLKCGNLDYPNGGSDENTCIPLPQMGEPCMNGGCADGLFCWRSPETDQMTACELPRTDGEACNMHTYYPIPCAAGLDCLGSTCRPACK